jgi:hypothetical protein
VLAALWSLPSVLVLLLLGGVATFKPLRVSFFEWLGKGAPGGGEGGAPPNFFTASAVFLYVAAAAADVAAISKAIIMFHPSLAKVKRLLAKTSLTVQNMRVHSLSLSVQMLLPPSKGIIMFTLPWLVKC